MKNSLSVQSVLVGVDFSKYSKSAVLQARALAEQWNVPMALVYGFTFPFLDELQYPDIIAFEIESYTKRLQRFYKVQKNEKIIVKCGKPVEQILKASQSLPQPLIVLGHRGSGGMISKFFFGSTAERVAQQSVNPVWIHRDHKSVQFNKVLIPCDLSDRAPYTAQFIKKNGPEKTKLELFHVIEQPMPLLDYEAWKTVVKESNRLNTARLKKFKKQHPDFKVIEEGGNVFDEIENRAKDFNFIALSPRKSKSFLQGFGSVTSKIVRSSQKSVLIIP